MWIGCGIYWVWIVLVDMLKRRWSINYTLINLGKVAWYVKAKRANQDWLYMCCILYMLICMQMVIYTRLIQSIRVLSEYDYISVSWLLLRICHNFHFSFSWAVWWPQCILVSSWPNFDGLTSNLVLLNSFIYVQLSSNGTGSTSGHWALCCLWVRVMFISSIRVNLHIRPCILVCAFL